MKKKCAAPGTRGVVEYKFGSRKKNTVACWGVGMAPGNFRPDEKILWSEIRCEAPPHLLAWRERPDFGRLVLLTKKQFTGALTKEERAALAHLREKFGIASATRKNRSHHV